MLLKDHDSVLKSHSMRNCNGNITDKESDKKRMVSLIATDVIPHMYIKNSKKNLNYNHFS